jgi:uncharacterized protein YndB with AHSA1/START domain
MKQPTKKLVIKRMLKADRRRVFSALSDPAKMAQWFYGMDTGRARVTCDFRVGGKYSIEMFNDEQQCVPTGEYLEIVPPEKLVFTWSVDGVVKDSKVTIELFEKGDRTEFVLTHELPQDVLERHQHGWVNCVNHLEGLLAQSDYLTNNKLK